MVALLRQLSRFGRLQPQVQQKSSIQCSPVQPCACRTTFYSYVVMHKPLETQASDASSIAFCTASPAKSSQNEQGMMKKLSKLGLAAS